MREDIEKKAKTCSTCFNAGKNLKSRIPNTENSKIELLKNPGEEFQIVFTANLNSKHLNSSHFILITVEKNRRGPVPKICEHAVHDTIKTFLRDYINFYGVPRTIKSKKAVLLPQKIQKIWNKFIKIRKYGPPNLHTGTGLVERIIQSMKNLIKANLENKQNLHGSLNKALYVLRFTIHSELKKTLI